MCTAVHEVTDTRLTRKIANTLACNMAERNIFLLSAHMQYGTNTEGVDLMMAPRWAAAIIIVVGSNDGHTLETTFISKDNLSQIIIIVAYPPPAGGTDRNKQRITNNQIRHTINKRIKKHIKSLKQKYIKYGH